MAGKVNSTSDPSGPEGNIGKKTIIKLIDNMTDDPEELNQILEAINYTLTARGSKGTQTALYRRMKQAEKFINDTISLLEKEETLREIIDTGRYSTETSRGDSIELHMSTRRYYGY